MTWRGAAALLILIGVLALALSTGGRTVYFILLFLAVFVLFCLVSVLISLFSAKCRPELTDAWRGFAWICPKGCAACRRRSSVLFCSRGRNRAR